MFQLIVQEIQYIMAERHGRSAKAVNAGILLAFLRSFSIAVKAGLHTPINVI